jgi:ABC-2 type transport system permease protein
MNRALWKKTIGEAQWLLLGCAAVLFSFCWMFVWLQSLFEMSRFQALLEVIRPEFERFSPVPFEHMLTYTGRIAVVYDHPLVFLTVAVWAIARGSDAVSGPLGRGTMEMVLGQPVGRLQVLLTQTMVSLGGVALLALSAWAGTWCGVHTVSIEEKPASWKVPGIQFELRNPFADPKPRWVPMSEKVAARHFVPPAVNLFSAGVFLAGLATLMSSWDRYRWRTIGVVSGFLIVQMILKVVAVSADELHWLVYTTYLGAYEPLQWVSISVYEPQQLWSFVLAGEEGEFAGVGPVGCNLALLLMGIASYVGAMLVFCRRDLPAPL